MSKIVRKRKKVKSQKEVDIIKEKEVKLQPNLFEYEGKLYAEGSIITIGRDPYLAKKTKRGGRKKKNKQIIPIETNEIVVADEEVREDNEEGDDENRWQGEYGEDIPERVLDDEIGSDEDEDGLIKPVDTKPKRKKPVYEEDIIFKEKDVEILEGEAKAIAKQMGLEYKKSKLVSEPIKYKVIEHEMRYKGYDKFIIAKRQKKDGSFELRLEPYVPTNTGKMRVFDGDFLPPPVPVFIRDEHTIDNAPPASYTGSLRLGDRVTFTLSESKEKDVEGIVLQVTDTTFTIVDPTNVKYENGKLYTNVEYKDAQNLRFKSVPEIYIGKKEGEVVIGKKTYYIDMKTITSKDNYLAKQSRKAPYKYAEFTLIEPKVEHLEGVIMDYGEEGFVVSILEKGMKVPSKTLEVNYQNPTIKKISKRLGIKDLEKDINTAEDYLHINIDPSTRVNATKRLFHTLASLFGIDKIYESPTDTDPLLNKLGESINWSVANSKYQEWSDYYKEQLREYLFSQLYGNLLEKAPSFEQEAQLEHRSITDPVSIIDGLLYTFGNIFDGNAARCLSMMNAKANESNFQPTIIDIAIRRELTKLGDEGITFAEKDVEIFKAGDGKPYKKSEIVLEPKINDIRGTELAKVIAHIINRTLQTNPPPSITLIELRMKNEWVINEINNRVPTKKERKRFDNKYLSELKKRYREYERQWKEEKEKKKEYKKLRSIIDKEFVDRANIQSSTHRLKVLSIDGKQLSAKGLELADAVSLLEQKLYIDVTTSSEASTNEAYLQKICGLILFLTPTDEIGKFANFFRSKIVSGIYSVDGLDAATQFHMFPEFFANTQNEDDVFEKGMYHIQNSITQDIIDFIDIYILGKSTRIRDTGYARFVWKDYVVDPAKTCGGMRVKPNLNLSGVDDAQNYDCWIQDELYVCKAKMEPIPDEDLILCYDDKLKKFSCASINDVLYALWDEDQGNEPVNPMTDRPYGHDFLQRMRDRYDDLYDKKLNSGGFKKRITKFKATADRLLFGGEDQEIVVY
jgi:hypothetical protein